MKCPTDGATLLLSDKQGIEIDYCPECRGVWLDRGELDKLMQQDEQRFREQTPRRSEEYRERRDYDDDDYRGSHKKKKSSFLGDIFEF